MRQLYLMFVIVLMFAGPALSGWSLPVYDVVIKNGHVMDPETDFDRKGFSVGIIGKRVEIITNIPLHGKKVIDAQGMVVSPGFIDLLSYDPTEVGVWRKLGDGVTANIAMHGGTAFPDTWYPRFERQNLPMHYGASFFYTEARNSLGMSRYNAATPEQYKKLYAMALKALQNGCLGVSFSLEYNPGITKEEIIPLMKLAKEYGVPVFFHTRYSDPDEPGTGVEGVQEVIDYARETGASVHIDHINSTGGTFTMPQALALVDSARESGLDITACVYPYHYWATYLSSARFDEGWQQRFRITYKDLQLGGSSERLTAASFKKYRRQGKLAVAYAMPEEDTIIALKKPYVIMGSDAILEDHGNNHPRASGTFCRLLGRYYREKKTVTLMEALSKMTILPAKRIENRCPAMKRKGRLSAGSDADIVIFNPQTVKDMATVEKPGLFSEGVLYVLVNGQIVKTPEGFNKKVRVGEPIRATDNIKP